MNRLCNLYADLSELGMFLTIFDSVGREPPNKGDAYLGCRL